jgi:hypothetical protein
MLSTNPSKEANELYVPSVRKFVPVVPETDKAVNASNDDCEKLP